MMEGQLSLFDMDNGDDKKPCEYKFKRYIGQKVKNHNGKFTIKEIEGYYTIMTKDDEKMKREWIGTPHDLAPVDITEYDDPAGIFTFDRFQQYCRHQAAYMHFDNEENAVKACGFKNATPAKTWSDWQRCLQENCPFYKVNL